MIEEITVETTAQGYDELVEFAEEHPLRAWAIEGTGGHGAGLTRHLQRGEEFVIELDRPERAKRGNGAKSDPLDAVRAAREALARPRLGTPRRGGDRQALSVLLATRRSAVEGATVAQRQLFSLVIAAPESLRARFRGQKLPAMVRTPAALRMHASWDTETTTTAAMLAGVAPIPANSGQITTRYRLNPYGDRQLNRALHTVAVTRMACHQPTRDYRDRRTAEGKTSPEIKRCLKRYIARDLYRLLEHPQTT